MDATTNVGVSLETTYQVRYLHSIPTPSQKHANHQLEHTHIGQRAKHDMRTAPLGMEGQLPAQVRHQPSLQVDVDGLPEQAEGLHVARRARLEDLGVRGEQGLECVVVPGPEVRRPLQLERELADLREQVVAAPQPALRVERLARAYE